jgi:hypothetical protein
MKNVLSAFAIAAVMTTSVAAQNLPLNNAVAGGQGDIVVGEGSVQVDGLVGAPSVTLAILAAAAVIAGIIIVADEPGAAVTSTP